MSLPKQENGVSNDLNSDLTGLTAGIVSAYVSNHVVPTSDLANLISDVHKALQTTAATSKFEATEIVEKQKPAVSIRKSVTDDAITCLECGESFKSLRRHLTTHHNLTPEEYREKWALGADYPMVSPRYSQARSNLAKEMGLGNRRQTKSNGRRSAA